MSLDRSFFVYLYRRRSFAQLQKLQLKIIQTLETIIDNY